MNDPAVSGVLSLSLCASLSAHALGLQIRARQYEIEATESALLAAHLGKEIEELKRMQALAQEREALQMATTIKTALQIAFVGLCLLSGCRLLQNDNCPERQTRCQGDYAQICTYSGTRRLWSSLNCAETRARNGEAQRCCQVNVPEAQFQGFTCAPVSACDASAR